MYQSEGKYREADTLYRRALAIREKALGKNHPDVGSTLHDLADVNRTQGRYGEAKRLYRRALGIREKALGQHHPDVAATLNGLARVNQALGAHDDAAVLYRRALAIREKALGPDHPDAAATLDKLIVLFRTQGKSGEVKGLELERESRALGRAERERAAPEQVERAK